MGINDYTGFTTVSDANSKNVKPLERRLETVEKEMEFLDRNSALYKLAENEKDRLIKRISELINDKKAA